VSSSAYRDVSLHRTVTHGDVEDMVPVKEIALEPPQDARIRDDRLSSHADAADGFGNRRPVSIVLRFSDGSVLTVPFEVRKRGS